jgi:hypothetical protein
MILSYRKRFESYRIDAFVVIDGLPAYMDPAAMTKLKQVLFLPMGVNPEQITQEQIPLGNVPKMVFSEAVGDLMRICGKSDATGSASAAQVPTTSQTV